MRSGRVSVACLQWLRWERRLGIVSASEWRPSLAKNTAMIPWSFRFFALSIASAIFGFGGMAGDYVGIVEALFVVFLLLLMGAIIAQGLREKSRAHHYFKPPSP